MSMTSPSEEEAPTICPTTNSSEVRRLLIQIETEHLAGKRAMHEYAATASHAVITARMETIGRHFESLAEIVGGKMPAMVLMADTLKHTRENIHAK
jgi:hypothetical protein